MNEVFHQYHGEQVKVLLIFLSSAALFFLLFKKTLMHVALILAAGCALTVLRGGILNLILVVICGSFVIVGADKLFYRFHRRRYER